MLSLALFICQYSLYLARPSLSPSIHCQCQSIRCYLCSLSYSNSNRLCCSHKQSVSNNSSRELDSSTLCHIHFGAQSDGGCMLFSMHCCLLSTAATFPQYSLSIFPHSFVSLFLPLSSSPSSVHPTPSLWPSASPQTS